MQNLHLGKEHLVPRLLLGATMTVLLGLGLFAMVLRPQQEDMSLMIVLMGGTGLLSVFTASLGYRSGWANRSPRLSWTLSAGYLLAGLLAFLNVWITARLMFASQHDLRLATVLLIFATGIAVTVGVFLSEAVTARIRALTGAARRVAEGHLDTRLEVTGRDEMSALAASFNEMVDRLQSAEQKKAEVETLRRDLIAWVGHDLRTPLTSVRAIVEALADGVVEDEAARQRYLRTAQADIQSLSTLIDDLFELSQIDAGGLRLNLAEGSVGDLISDTVERFSALAAQKGIRLEGSRVEGLGTVRMDEQRIGRVLANLVSNALRHTPAGGQVRIRVEPSPHGPLISVQDSGDGIAPEDLPAVFERFYRGEKSRSRATGGAGLGLAIARGIVEAHGGQIGVENLPGQGARFWFWLPG